MNEKLHEDYHAEARKMQDHFFETSRVIRAEGGEEVAPIGFVVKMDVPPVVAMVPLAPLPDKDAWAFVLKLAAKQMAADYVLLNCEAWILSNERVGNRAVAEGVAANMAGVSLEDVPGRVEVLMSQMDGRGIKRMLTAEIFEDGTLGETKIVEASADEYEDMGRLANLSGYEGEK